MQLNNKEQTESVAGRANFTIFELPKSTDFTTLFPNTFHLKDPEDKTVIPIESIHEITSITANKQGEQLFSVIEEADKMSIGAANAFLKSLEEPGENVHYVFLTRDSRAILPTIRSRAQCFYLGDDEKVADPPHIDEELKALAKSYISANQSALPDVVDKILKYDKKSPRESAIKVLDAAIHLSYKSYLITGNASFLQKIEQLLAAQDAISQNGHVKLQLIANML
jgi:DNA polymerase III gamma/tau subunit